MLDTGAIIYAHEVWCLLALALTCGNAVKKYPIEF
jgi:hypothetical protein